LRSRIQIWGRGCEVVEAAGLTKSSCVGFIVLVCFWCSTGTASQATDNLYSWRQCKPGYSRAVGSFVHSLVSQPSRQPQSSPSKVTDYLVCHLDPMKQALSKWFLWTYIWLAKSSCIRATQFTSGITIRVYMRDMTATTLGYISW
jgi:hypothetical protein